MYVDKPNNPIILLKLFEKQEQAKTKTSKQKKKLG
jgi:hypothetical protein